MSQRSSHTHCQVAQADTRPKLVKECACPNARSTAKLKVNCLKMNKGQLVTRYIKHLAYSANFKGGTFNKQRNGLIGNRFEMPNVSFTHPLAASEKNNLPLVLDNLFAKTNLILHELQK
jgi:hypothetical protein